MTWIEHTLIWPFSIEKNIPMTSASAEQKFEPSEAH